MFKQLLARAREARAAELEGESGFEGGFTLIELMVVLLIIAILLAIAIPTFLGVTGSAKDRAAQSTLTNVLTETVATYQNSQAYPAQTPITNYSASDPQFKWVVGSTDCTASPADAKCVSVMPVDVAASADSQGVILAVLSNTGTCWWAVNLQATPANDNTFGGGTADTNAFVSGQTVSGTNDVATAGTFYAQKSNSGTSGCSASAALSGFKWSTSYANAPQS